MPRRFLLVTALLSAALLLLFSSVQVDKPHASPSPSRLPSFSDITRSAGIQFKNEASHTSQKYFIETMEGGAALVDYDGDGFLDIFLVNGAALSDPMLSGKDPDKSDRRYWNRLYRNNGDRTFRDVTESAGVAGHHYGMGVAVGDYNNDGYPDLYVTNFGANILYHNNGNGTFAETTARAGVVGGGWSTSACFVDYDRDGWLDLIVGRYVEWDFDLNPWCGEHKPGYRSYCHPDNFKPTQSLVFHNNRDGTFADVSAKTGFAAAPGKALGIAFNDLDRDGWPDIVIANDEFPQQFFENNQDGTFTEAAKIKGLAFDEDGHVYAGMGVDLQDYDNDGWPDVFINALSNQKYALYKNAGANFEYVSGPSGIAGITMLRSGWGAKFIDYDNDGWKDLFVAQGHVMDNIQLTQPSFRYLEPLLLMHNGKGKFEDVSKQSGAVFEVLRAARGAAFGDLDNDGNVDVVVNCNNGEAVVLRNQGGTKNHWLLVSPIGSISNHDGIGARIRLVSESGQEQLGLVSTAGSYLSASDRRVHFGLGADRMVKLLEITWPNGAVQRLEKVEADQILRVEEPKASESNQSVRQ